MLEITVSSAIQGSESHYVAIAVASESGATPTVVEIISLAKFREFKKVSIPATQQIYVCTTTSAGSLAKMKAIPATLSGQTKPISVQGIKSCRLTISKDADGVIHFNMSNVE